MNDRRKIEQLLSEIQEEMKKLEIRYEQYFAGVEKREPQRERTELARQIRQLTNKPIFQTDIKFRYQGLASRFYSYTQYWDRILRLMDEGKYHRHLSPKPELPDLSSVRTAEPAKAKEDEIDRLLQALLEARQSCGQQGPPLTRDKVREFLAAQKQKVQEKFGDRSVEFVVDTSSGKPQIKVRPLKE
jgi:hypothetical protein